MNNKISANNLVLPGYVIVCQSHCTDTSFGNAMSHICHGFHFVTFKHVEVDNIKISKLRKLHHCLLNGIGNIYIHNCITYMDELEVKERIRKKREEREDQSDGKERTKKKTFWRQVLFNMIFIAENIAIITFVCLRIPDTVPTSLLVFIGVGHLVGSVFNIIYYQFFHLWKDVLHMHVHLPSTFFEDSNRKSI